MGDKTRASELASHLKQIVYEHDQLGTVTPNEMVTRVNAAADLFRFGPEDSKGENIHLQSRFPENIGPRLYACYTLAEALVHARTDMSHGRLVEMHHRTECSTERCGMKPWDSSS